MRVFAVVALLALAVVAVSARAYTEKDYQKAFTQFVKTYEKAYAHDEFFSRFNVFKNNMQMIAEHNMANHTYTLAMNEFGDLTFAEFHARYTGYKAQDRSYARSLNNAHKSLKSAPLADSVDWREKNAVTPVKDQGQCGSCWAFSTTGSVEGAHALKTGNLVSFSEQQLVDCSSAQGNQGCNGGLMDNAFQYIMQNKGLCTEASYPYKGTAGTCDTSCTVAGGAVTSYKDVAANDETDLMRAVNLGPVSIAIEADQSVFQFYSGGVLSDTGCGTQLDHGVLVVGYGTDATTKQDYWIVKNSWGASWGEKGFIRLIRGQNECGVAAAASYPIIA